MFFAKYNHTEASESFGRCAYEQNRIKKCAIYFALKWF